MTIEVRDVAAVALQMERVVAEMGGLVTTKMQSGEDASYTLSIPAPRLDGMLDRLAKLGKTTSRSISARDVTDEAVDLDARLNNKRALRDRLRQLLGTTTTLQEVLTLEEHLARVQAEVDMLEAQQKRLLSSVEMSHVDFWIRRQRQLGPLGYVFGGLWWGLKKLFVWR